MSRADAAWLALWAAFGVLDWCADRRGVSLSVTARHLFRTDTRTGKAAFSLAYGAGAVALFAHIVKEQHAADNA